MKAVWKPEDYCPICGVRLYGGHRCDQKKLAAIDKAHRSDMSPPPPSSTFGMRLSEGVKMHHLSQGEG